MSKLSEIVFKPVLSKEVESFGHKVTLRALNTKDNIDLDLRPTPDGEKLNNKDVLVLATKILSTSLVSVDGIVPDNSKEVIDFLEQQDSEVVLDLLSKYQEMTGVTEEEIKN